MTVRNLDKILKPHRIALFGACERANNLGAEVLHNLLSGQFGGVVYPVQHECESIHGVATYPALESLPRVPDLGIVCSPNSRVAQIVRACGAFGVKGVLIMSGGFRECGADGLALEEEIKDIVAEYPGLRVLGPNSLGVIHPSLGLNASHATTMPKPGRLAFISESRALCNSVLDWATDEGIGFSTFVSTGNRLDIDFGDLIDYFGNDPETRAIILYVQSIEHARSFISAARAFALLKPIVVYKAGRFAESARAVASHTGALVAADAVYEAAFKRCGVVRVTELDDIFDMAEVLASRRLPRGARLAIVTNAGAPAIIAADALLLRGGELARLADATVGALDGVLPPVGSHLNPVDLLDSAPAERYAQALPPVLTDPGVDAVLVIFATQSGSDATATAEAIVAAARNASKPVLVALMGGRDVQQALRLCNQAGLPTHRSPEKAVRSFDHLVSYARNLEELYRTPREIPLAFESNRRNLRTRLRPLLERQGNPPGDLGMTFLRAYGIPVCDAGIAEDVDTAVAIAGRLGYPVVLKVLSPEIVHKVDVGGVALNLGDAAAVRAAYARLFQNVRRHRGEVRIDGVTVQRMHADGEGVELILGAKKDPTFGAVIMVGVGGIAAGIMKDRAVGLPPLNERLVRQMLESLRAWPMLNGYRGLPPVDLDALIEAIIRFSVLVADYPEIREFDINPLHASAGGVIALDAMLIPGHEADIGTGPHPHLAIRPYPEEYVRHMRSADGVLCKLRSVRPEDEPYWHAMIASSSAESIRFRFRSLIRESTHEMAVSQCAIDHERQISIVAETELDGQRILVGIAQLLADVNHETAEFAVLVADPWQGKKIGGMLLDYSIELATEWGIRRIVAETDPHNRRMLATFRKRGFSAETHFEDDVTLLELVLREDAPRG